MCLRIDGDMLLSSVVSGVPSSSSISCDTGGAQAVNSALKAYAGPLGKAQKVGCNSGAFLHDDTSCAETAAALNQMIDAYLSGLFVNCSITTPTSIKGAYAPV